MFTGNYSWVDLAGKPNKVCLFDLINIIILLLNYNFLIS